MTPTPLAALADDDGVGVGVHDVDVVAREDGDVDGAEFSHAVDVALVDEHPVNAGFETGGDAALTRLPVADGVVGFQPDGVCHISSVVGRLLNVAGAAGFARRINHTLM
jgi:hypothetical protein